MVAKREVLQHPNDIDAIILVFFVQRFQDLHLFQSLPMEPNQWQKLILIAPLARMSCYF